MIQLKQPKKIKGKRRKERDEIKERLMSKFPTWFEGRSDIETNNLITAFKHSGKPDEEFPDVCIEYEKRVEYVRNYCKKS